MKHCHYCNTKLEDDAYICPHCGQTVNGRNMPGDKPNVLLGILSFLLFPLGFIFFFVWHKKRPKRAKSCIIGAVIGIITIAATIGVFYLLIYLLFNAIAEGLRGAGESINEGLRDAILNNLCLLPQLYY